jgi:hypothetical protein
MGKARVDCMYHAQSGVQYGSGVVDSEYSGVVQIFYPKSDPIQF